MKNVLSTVSHLYKYLIRAFFMIIVFGAIITIFVSYLKGNKIQTQDPVQQNRKQIYSMIQDVQKDKSKEGKIITTIYKGVFCSTIGEACTNNPEDGDKNFHNSLFGMVGNLMVIPYMNPPASGALWAMEGLQHVGLVPQTQAAGIGFYSLSAFQPIWNAFRTITYLLMVILIVAIGFMIMFRMKLNPQTVISIETALPRIVLTLIFITFSYAIAGFLIDLMYIILLFIFQIFSTIGVNDFTTKSLQDRYLTESVFSTQALGTGFNLYFNGLLNLYKILPSTIQAVIQIALALVDIIFVVRIAQALKSVLSGVLTIVASPVGAGVMIGLGELLVVIFSFIVGGGLVPILIYVVIFAITVLGLFSLFFRIFFFLIGAYIQVIIQVIFAPFFILPNIIPGQNSFVNWLKKLFGFLLVFPLVILFLIIIESIQRIMGNHPTTSAFSMPGLYGFDTQSLSVVISAAMLFMMPDIIRSFIKPMVGESNIKPGAGVLFAGLAGGAGGTMGAITTLRSLRGHSAKPTGVAGFAQKILTTLKIGD